MNINILWVVLLMEQKFISKLVVKAFVTYRIFNGECPNLSYTKNSWLHLTIELIPYIMLSTAYARLLAIMELLFTPFSVCNSDHHNIVCSTITPIIIMQCN